MIKQKIYKIILIVFKNLTSFLIGGVLGILITLLLARPLLELTIKEDIGLGIIAIAPLFILMYLIFFGTAGGLLGIFIYNLKFFKKKKKLLYTETGPNGTAYKKGEWEKFAIHNDTEIKGFFGEYRFLSNFWSAKVYLDDVEYPSVELAYQSAKWKPESRDYFKKCTELESIDYNRKNIPDGYSKEVWDKKKLEIMKDLVKQKFDPKLNTENYKKLLATGTKHLEEMNWWEDLYWGTNKDGKGKNMLGKILMEVRENNK